MLKEHILEAFAYNCYKCLLYIVSEENCINRFGNGLTVLYLRAICTEGIKFFLEKTANCRYCCGIILRLPISAGCAWSGNVRQIYHHI